VIAEYAGEHADITRDCVLEAVVPAWSRGVIVWSNGACQCEVQAMIQGQWVAQAGMSGGGRCGVNAEAGSIVRVLLSGAGDAQIEVSAWR